MVDFKDIVFDDTTDSDDVVLIGKEIIGINDCIVTVKDFREI